MYHHNPDNFLPYKLTPKWQGPFEVISHEKNIVECRHVSSGVVKHFENTIERMKIFHGTKKEAYEASLWDNNQFVIQEILSSRGDPDKRTTMEFEVKFADNSINWLTWTKDLSDSIPFETYCRKTRYLLPLVYTVENAKVYLKNLKTSNITSVSPGDICYVNLRFYNDLWYQNLNLPNKDHINYLVPFQYLRWSSPTSTKQIDVRCEIFNEFYSKRTNEFVTLWGSQLQFIRSATCQLVDANFVRQFPQVLPVNIIPPPVIPPARPRGRPRKTIIS